MPIKGITVAVFVGTHRLDASFAKVTSRGLLCVQHALMTKTLEEAIPSVIDV